MRIKSVKHVIAKFVIGFVTLEFLFFSFISFYCFSKRIKKVELKIAYYHLVLKGTKGMRKFELFDINGKPLNNPYKKQIFELKKIKKDGAGILLVKNKILYYLKDSQRGKIVVYKISISSFLFNILFVPFVLTVISFIVLLFFYNFFKFNTFSSNLSEGLKAVVSNINKIIENKTPKLPNKKFVLKEFEDIFQKLSELYKKVLYKEKKWKVSLETWKKVSDKFPLLLIFLENGKRIISFNKPAKEFFGDKISELLSVKTSGLEPLLSNIKNVFNYSKSFNLEKFPLEGKNGEKRLFEILLIPFEAEKKKGVLFAGLDETQKVETAKLIEDLMEIEDRALILTDSKGIVNFSNEKIAMFLGIKKEELMGKDIFEFFEEGSSRIIDKEKESVGSFTTYLKRRILRKIIVKVNYLISRDFFGEKKFLFVIEDITRELALHEELRFVKVLRAIGAESSYLLGGKRSFRDTITNIAKILGFERICFFRKSSNENFVMEDEVRIEEEKISTSYFFSIGEEVDFRKIPILKKTLLENRVVFFKNDSAEPRIANFMKHRDIKMLMAFPVFTGAQVEKFIIFVNYAKKITFSIKEMDAIREAFKFIELYFKIKYYRDILKERFSTILAIYNDLEDPVYLVDPATFEIVYKNKGFVKKFGSEVEGRKCYEVVFGRNKPCFSCVIKRKKMDIVEEDKKIKVFGENYFYVEQRIVELLPRKSFIVNLFTDVSEKVLFRRRAEQTQKKELLGDLIGGISHDMNNILSGMSGYLELLELTSVEGKRDEYLVRIKKILEKAHKMVFQTLSFSREGEDKPEVQSIVKILEEVMIIVDPSLPKNVQLEWESKGEYFVKAISNQLMQVFLNLLTNARDALRNKEDGKIQVEVNSQMIGSGDAKKWNVERKRYVVIKVKDNGEGIEKKHLNKIFEPFFSTKEKDETKGSGIGLYITKRIINSHGGFIKVSSRKGEGTTFSVYLPQYKAKTEEKSKEEKAALPLELKGKFQGKAIILSDGDIFPELVQQLLEFLGINTFYLNNILEARDTAKKEKADYLFLDLSLNKEREKEITRFVSFIKKHIKKIIFLSSAADKEFAEKLETKYDVNILIKPFSIYSLSGLLKK